MELIVGRTEDNTCCSRTCPARCTLVIWRRSFAFPAFAGVQGLREISDELTVCVLQIRSESVQKHGRLLQLLKMREMELCETLGELIAKGAQCLLKRTFLWQLQVDGDFSEQARVMHCLLAAESCYMRRGTRGADSRGAAHQLRSDPERVQGAYCARCAHERRAGSKRVFTHSRAKPW